MSHENYDKWCEYHYKNYCNEFNNGNDLNDQELEEFYKYLDQQEANFID